MIGTSEFHSSSVPSSDATTRLRNEKTAEEKFLEGVGEDAKQFKDEVDLDYFLDPDRYHDWFKYTMKTKEVLRYTVPASPYPSLKDIEGFPYLSYNSSSDDEYYSDPRP